MAKAIILNATEVKLKLKGKWRTGIDGSIHHSTSVTVKDFNTNYIDDIFYEMKIIVTNSGEDVYSNTASISHKDSYSFLVYRNAKDHDRLYVGHRHKLTDSYPTRMLVLAHATYKLKQMKNKTEKQKNQLEKDLEELAKNDMYVP